MVEAAVVTGISDVKLNWSHVLNNGALSPKRVARAFHFPEFQKLVENMVTPAPSPVDVLTRLPDEATLLEMRTWLEEHCRTQYKLFGRIGWTDTGFAVKRDLKGLLVTFKDPEMALMFKMVFYHRPDCAE